MVPPAIFRSSSATASLTVHAPLPDPIAHVPGNQVRDEADVCHTRHADHHEKQRLLPRHSGQRVARVADKVDHEVHVDDDEQERQTPRDALQTQIVGELAHQFRATREVQHRQQCEGQLNALQNVQPLVRAVGKGRIGL